MVVPDGAALAREFVAVAHAVANLPGGNGEKVRVARLTTDRGPDRTLRNSDNPLAVTASLDAAAKQHAAHLAQVITAAASRNVEAITAAGGLGAPRQADYSLPGFESAERPVKGALPAFTAERGGVRFVQPPSLPSVNGAIGIWTVANDVAAATNTAIRKPAQRVLPGGEV